MAKQKMTTTKEEFLTYNKADVLLELEEVPEVVDKTKWEEDTVNDDCLFAELVIAVFVL